MSLEEIIEVLKSAETPSRNLDADIATAIGWRRGIGKAAPGRAVKVWISPTHQEADRVPFYTDDIQHAMDLADFVAPGRKGVSWEGGTGFAKINDGPSFQAATPAIALCLAALDALMRNQNDGTRPSSGSTQR